MSKATRRFVSRVGISVAASMTAIAAVAGGSAVISPAPAQAQESSAQPANPQQFLDGARQQFDQFTKLSSDNARTAALQWRTQVYSDTANWDPTAASFVRNTVDSWINGLWPNAISDEEAAQAAARQTAAEAAARQASEAQAAQTAAITEGCPEGAKACVNIEAQRSWLQDGKNVTYGPVAITTGRPGEETPRGWHTVLRKVKDETSQEFNNAPMPYSVYFTNTGVAFHEGSLSRESAGCVHLSEQAAQHYFDALQVGDRVYVY